MAHTHIDNLTGVQPATLARYRTYVERDVDPVFGSLPVSAVTETTIARWVKQLGGSGKTIANKHGFVSGAFNAAVRAGVMASNPCVGRRLPHTRVDETVFLTPAEFKLLRDHIERERWKNLATWLVTTGMRFSEATALSAADIDADAKTCRINKAWKYSGTIGPRSARRRRRSRSAPSACRRRPSRSSTSPRRVSCSPTAPGIPFVRKSSSMVAGSPVRAAPWPPG